MLLVLAACYPSESDEVESEVVVTHVGDEGAEYAALFAARGADALITDTSVAQVILDDYRDHLEDRIVVEFACDFGRGFSAVTTDIRNRHGGLGTHYFRQAGRAPFEVPCTVRFDKVAEIEGVPDVTLRWHIHAEVSVESRKNISLDLEIEEL